MVDFYNRYDMIRTMDWDVSIRKRAFRGTMTPPALILLLVDGPSFVHQG